MKNNTSCGKHFPYSFEFRISELSEGFETDLTFIQAVDAVLSEYAFKTGDSSLEVDAFIYRYMSTIKEQRERSRSQPGIALSLFHYLYDLACDKTPQKINRDRIFTAQEFLAREHLLYPMLLIRPHQKHIDEVQEDRYISCIYTVDCYGKLNVSDFLETEIAKVWFNRVKHSELADFNNTFFAGVMYFCPKTKELLFINNASGHYRVLDIHNMRNIKSILEANEIEYHNACYANYDDVEFKAPFKILAH